MTLVVRQNVTGVLTAAPVQLDRRRRRLSTIAKRYSDRGRPFIVSVHRHGDVLRPDDGTCRLRKQWKHTLVGPRDIVLITRLPMGGGGGGSNQTKAIGSAVAMVALAIAAPYLATGVLGVLSPGAELTFASKALAAGLLVGPGYAVSREALCRH